MDNRLTEKRPKTEKHFPESTKILRKLPETSPQKQYIYIYIFYISVYMSVCGGWGRDGAGLGWCEVTGCPSEMCCGFCRAISSSGGWVSERGLSGVMVWFGSSGVVCFLCVLCSLPDPAALALTACSGLSGLFWKRHMFRTLLRWLMSSWQENLTQN